MSIDGDEWVRISVSDNGSGVPTAILDRIFDPFFTTKPAGQGTGLGLFLSYGIVLDHRGRLEVRNDDVGAVFEVYLPAVGLETRIHEGALWGLQEKS
jgi:signal transduction histidine kinase